MTAKKEQPKSEFVAVLDSLTEQLKNRTRNLALEIEGMRKSLSALYGGAGRVEVPISKELLPGYDPDQPHALFLPFLFETLDKKQDEVRIVHATIAPESIGPDSIASESLSIEVRQKNSVLLRSVTVTTDQGIKVGASLPQEADLLRLRELHGNLHYDDTTPQGKFLQLDSAETIVSFIKDLEKREMEHIHDTYVIKSEVVGVLKT